MQEPGPRALVSDGGVPALDGFVARMRALPALSLRRVGWTMMQVGMVVATVSIPLPIAVCNIGVGIAGAGCLLARPPLLRLPAFAWGFAYALWIAISVLVTILSGAHQAPIHGFGLMYTWLALYLAMVAFAERRALALAMGGLAVVVLASALLACLQFTIGFDITKDPWRINPHPPGTRFTDGQGFQGLRLTQGFLMCVALLCLQASLPVPRHLRIVGRAAAALALVLSRARLAYIGAVVGIFAWIACRGRSYLLRAIVVTLVAGALLTTAMWLIQRHKLDTMIHGKDQRWAIWRTSLAMVEAHPLVGVGGPEAYKDAYRLLFPIANPGEPNGFPDGASPHAHNSFLSIAAEHGAPALGLYLGLLGAIGWWAFRRRDVARERWRLVAALIAAYLSAGMFENLAGHATPSYAMFIGLGLALSLRPDAPPAVSEDPRPA